MRVGIIGGGVSGLCATKFVSEAFPDAVIDVFEATDGIGGNWVYNPKTGRDEYNLPIMSSIYDNLRANLPKMTMSLTDFPIPEDYAEFMPHKDFLNYIRRYADHFDLCKYIKFRHVVKKVQRLENCWEVTYEDLKSQTSHEDSYDFVYVCSGHYQQTFTPELKGADIFKGKQSHSQIYRKSEEFKNKKVLIIGIGPSGFDISVELAKVCKRVILSHHMPVLRLLVHHVIHKPDVKEFTEYGVVFQDGSSEEIDEVIYCTGYEYSFPFLDDSCGVAVAVTHVKPLYHHIVNVEHPSMFFIGIPTNCCAIVLRDMQVRYTVALLQKKFDLPSKVDMLNLLKKKEDERRKENKSEKFTHNLYYDEDDYFDRMSIEAGIERVPKVFCKIRQHIVKSGLYEFRNKKYHVIDDNFYTTG